MHAGPVSLTVFVAILSSPTMADEFVPSPRDDTRERIESLESSLEDLQQELKELRETRSHSGADRTAAKNASSTIWGCDSLSDEYPTLKWSGFIQLDSGWVSQDDRNTLAVGDVSARTGLRRVRLRAAGHVRKRVSYVVDLDFAAGGHPSFRDVALAYSDVPWIQNVRVGYFKQPFGMDAESSGQELLFLERQSPFALTPFRQTGVSAYGTLGDGAGTYAVSGFVFPTDSFGVNDGDSGGWSLATRLTALPYDDGDDHLMHVGFGYAMSNPSNNRVQFAIEPGFFVTDPDDTSRSSVPVFVDSGRIPTNVVHLFNAELAAQSGPFRIQSETRFAVVDRRFGGPAVGFPATYVQFGYVLTGESPEYDRDRAIFHRVRTSEHRELGNGCGFGAVEATGGWSYISLDDETVRGGRMQQFVVGLNWYPTEHTRIVLNVVPLILTSPGIGHGNAVVAAGRVQVAF